MSDNNAATDTLVACVVDVVAKFAQSTVDVGFVRKTMSRYGSLARVIPWTSTSQNRQHFYVQFEAVVDFERARAAEIPSLLASAINRDPAHRTRFLSLISREKPPPPPPSSSKGSRYTPYDSFNSRHASRLREGPLSPDDSTSATTGPRAALPARPSFDSSRAPAKRPAGASQAGPIRSQAVTTSNRTGVSVLAEPASKNRRKASLDGHHASSKEPPLSRADLPAHFTSPPNSSAVIRLPLTPESQTPSPPQPIAALPVKPKLDIVLHGETVSLPVDSNSTAQSVIALLDASNAAPDQWARTARNVARQGHRATAEEIKRHAPLEHLGQQIASSQLNAEEVIKRLTELHAQHGKESSRQDEAEHPLAAYAVDPRFDIKSHITSGRFLQADSTNPAVPFKLSPMQEYFADVYAKLQTDLQASKERSIQLELDYERECVLRDKAKADLAVERLARKSLDRQLKASERQLTEERARIATLEAGREQDRLALEQARKELEDTKDLLGRIGLLVRTDKQPSLSAAPRCM